MSNGTLMQRQGLVSGQPLWQFENCLYLIKTAPMSSSSSQARGNENGVDQYGNIVSCVPDGAMYLFYGVVGVPCAMIFVTIACALFDLWQFAPSLGLGITVGAMFLIIPIVDYRNNRTEKEPEPEILTLLFVFLCSLLAYSLATEKDGEFVTFCTSFICFSWCTIIESLLRPRITAHRKNWQAYQESNQFLVFDPDETRGARLKYCGKLIIKKPAPCESEEEKRTYMKRVDLVTDHILALYSTFFISKLAIGFSSIVGIFIDWSGSFAIVIAMIPWWAVEYFRRKRLTLEPEMEVMSCEETLKKVGVALLPSLALILVQWLAGFEFIVILVMILFNFFVLMDELTQNWIKGKIIQHRLQRKRLETEDQELNALV